jgi:hypothetical protein
VNAHRMDARANRPRARGGTGVGWAVLLALACGLSSWASPSGDGAADVDHAVWLLRCKGLIPDLGGKAGKQYDLNIHLVRHDGKFVGGLGWSLPKEVARPFNRATHSVRTADLRFADGALTGHLDVTLNPDPWIPPDHQSWRGRITIDGKVETAKLGQQDAISGTFAADFDGRKTEGAFQGPCLKQERLAPENFSTCLVVGNGWINSYGPFAKRLVLGLNFQNGKAVAVKLGTLAAWGDLNQISYLGEAPEAVFDVAVTPTGFEGQVSLTRIDPVRDGDAPPARYRFDLKAVRIQNKFGGTVQVTMTRGGQESRQDGWMEGAREAPWKPEVKETDPQPTCTVEAELVEKCAQPRREEVAPYTEAIGVYVYRVANVMKGELKDNPIGVAHWVMKRYLDQPVTKSKPGDRVTLQLCPFPAAGKSIQTVYRKEAAGTDGIPHFFDCAQKLVYPEGAPNRWSYNVDSSAKFQRMFLLKDQLKLVTLGDCQGWYANRAELYLREENRKTPVAYNLCQKRSGIDYQKLMIETYFVRLPKLEWIVVTWNARWLSGTWAEHGVKGRELEKSPGFQYDKQHLDELFKPEDKPPLTVAEAGERDWGWNSGLGEGGGGARGGDAIFRGQQYKLGSFMFVPERWADFESAVRRMAETARVKMLVYTQPIHPASAKFKVKGKNGTDEESDKFLVTLMRGLEKKHPDRFFFYDLNNSGDNGLAPGDFGDEDHVSGRGARRVTERVEAYRLEIERLLSAGAPPDRRAAALEDLARALRTKERPPSREAKAEPKPQPKNDPETPK